MLLGGNIMTRKASENDLLEQLVKTNHLLQLMKIK